MVRSLGVQVVPAADLEPAELAGVSVLVNALSALIDVAPLFVLMVSSDWKEVNKYFSVKGFALGAIMNLMLVVHVLFVLEEEHLDVLFLATVGLSLGTAYTFLLLGHRVVTNDQAKNARYWMLVVLVSFVIACYAVFCGIFVKYKAKGYFLNGVLIVAVGVLDVVILFPILTCKPFRDQDRKIHTVVMCLFNTIDAGFFVLYAVSLGSLGTALSVVSMINTACGLIQLIAMVALVLVKGLRKAGDYFRSWGDSCCGFFRLMATLFDVFGRHDDRTD